MAKEIMVVYQDCVFCGDKGKKTEVPEIAKRKGLVIKKVPFYKEFAKDLIWKAFEQGVGSLPFFTDGEKFSYNLEDFIEKPKTKRKGVKKDEPSE